VHHAAHRDQREAPCERGPDERRVLCPRQILRRRAVVSRQGWADLRLVVEGHAGGHDRAGREERLAHQEGRAGGVLAVLELADAERQERDPARVALDDHLLGRELFEGRYAQRGALLIGLELRLLERGLLHVLLDDLRQAVVEARADVDERVDRVLANAERVFRVLRLVEEELLEDGLRLGPPPLGHEHGAKIHPGVGDRPGVPEGSALRVEERPKAALGLFIMLGDVGAVRLLHLAQRVGACLAAPQA
jgi:hypothetical protein